MAFLSVAVCATITEKVLIVIHRSLQKKAALDLLFCARKRLQKGCKKFDEWRMAEL
jgi:hypothetical protein